MRLRAHHWLDTAALALVAAAIAGPGLAIPDVLVLDEVYYVSDAISQLDVGVARSFTAHPPLGTWLISGGISLGGNSPVGWRLAPLGAGIVTVALLHRLTLRLLPDTQIGRIGAAGAAILLLTDGTWLVLARTAMLDGPLTMLVLAAATAAAAAAEARGRQRAGWLVAAGMASGAAMAVKWSGAIAVPLTMVILASGTTEAVRRRVRQALGAAPLVLLAAAAVYASAWVPYAVARGEVPVASCPLEAAPCATTGGLIGVVDQHVSLARYHTTLQLDSPAAAPPSLWPLMQVPVTFHHPACNTRSNPVEDPIALEVPTDCGAADASPADTIVFSGNPVLWFGFLVLLPALAAATRGDRAARVALAGWGLAWLPWLAVTRTSYLWYLAPAVPFAALAIVATAQRVPAINLSRTYLFGLVGAGTGALLTFAPGVPFGTTLIGWAVGGWTARGPEDNTPRHARHAVIAMVAIALSAAVVGLTLHDRWTTG